MKRGGWTTTNITWLDYTRDRGWNQLELRPSNPNELIKYNVD